MNNSTNAQVILVDTRNNPIGSMEKLEAHTTPKLHRAFSVFLYHQNKMFIQQRALNKYHSGGKWSNGCCSHPRIGEELTSCVQTRMVEELGFSCPVKELFQFIYFAKLGENLYEYEYDHVFLGEYNGEIALNPEEAMDACWIELEDLEDELIENPEKYSVWFLHCVHKVIAEIRNLNS